MIARKSFFFRVCKISRNSTTKHPCHSWHGCDICTILLKMNARSTIVVVLTVAAIAATIIGKRELGWYGGKLAQRGPFHGEPFVETISGDPRSHLDVARGFVAETYLGSGDQGSILRLTGGGTSWAVRLLGRDVDSPVQIPIRNVFLRGVRRWGSGYMILFEGEWKVSGSESGMIYLNSDMTLNHFTLR